MKFYKLVEIKEKEYVDATGDVNKLYRQAEQSTWWNDRVIYIATKNNVDTILIDVSEDEE